MPGPFANARARNASTNDQPQVDTAELDRTRRQLAEMQAASAAQKADAEKLKEQLRVAQSERDKIARDSWLREQAAKHKALKPEHVSRLIGDDLEVIEGKVTVRGKPDVNAEQFVADWFAKEGTPYVAPAIAPGAGAPAVAGTVPQAQPLDLKTPEGATQFVRSLGLKK